MHIQRQEVPDKFKVLEEYAIDLQQGFQYMGENWETYEEILHIFFQELPDKFVRLSRYQKQKDLENYRIDIHALKSTAKSVGATALAELALKHEEESRRGNGDYVWLHFKELCLEGEKILEAGRRFEDVEK